MCYKKCCKIFYVSNCLSKARYKPLILYLGKLVCTYKICAMFLYTPFKCYKKCYGVKLHEQHIIGTKLLLKYFVHICVQLKEPLIYICMDICLLILVKFSLLDKGFWKQVVQHVLLVSM